MNKLVVVTGYVQIPGHPRSSDQYQQLGERLSKLKNAPVRVFRCGLKDCWLDEHVVNERCVHAVGDNPDKNSRAYHVVQHQKTAWLLQALEADPDAEIFVWLDYGILHQPGVTEDIIDDFLLRAVTSTEISIPGSWKRSNNPEPAAWQTPDWRFLGSLLIVPRDLVRSFHGAVQEVTLERLSAAGQLTWEINDWSEVERRRVLPIRWYEADHNQTQFTNYTGAATPPMGGRQDRYVYDPDRGNTEVVGFPTVILGYSAAGTTHIVPGRYERNLVDWAQHLAPAEKQFVDCGAHMGSWALVMATHFREVHAFEPQRLIFQQLCGNVALNGLTNVFAHNVGLDATSSQLTLHRPGVDRGSSSVRTDVAARFEEEGVFLSPEIIEVVPLDNFIGTLSEIGLMKIDVEGLELRVLKGAVRVLQANDLPKLIVECWSNDWYRQDKANLLEFLDTIGYRIVPIAGYADILLAEKK